MRGTIAITDSGWYEMLLVHPELAEVNFWTPSPRRSFGAHENTPFFFKLRSPASAICGFGFFNRYVALPDWLAWESFGIGNGCETLEAMRERIGQIRRRTSYRGDIHDPHIGCVLILAPMFFPKEDWVSQPSDWRAPTQTYKMYDLTSGEGLRVWKECQDRASALGAYARRLEQGVLVKEEQDRYGQPILVRPRMGQYTFRVAVMEAYEWGCSVTSEHSLPALEAAHIRPYGQSGPHDVANGLLLRADLHRLFDKGYLAVTPDLKLEVSTRLKEDYENGHTYYPMHGQTIRVPERKNERPSPEFLRWHCETIYRG
jgi:putative restriction endonuclease